MTGDFMDNTGFILDFLRDLEVEMKKIGLKSVIDLKILKRDMFLKDDNTLGVWHTYLYFDLSWKS